VQLHPTIPLLALKTDPSADPQTFGDLADRKATINNLRYSILFELICNRIPLVSDPKLIE
jgi:hypothetical protein